MAGQIGILPLLLALTACSASVTDTTETDASRRQATTEDGPPLDGTVFGAPSSELAKAGLHPRPLPDYEPTAEELNTLAAELADGRDRRSAFRAAKVDLNGDGIDEILTLFADGCGSGGCSFRIYAKDGDRFRKVSGSTLTRMPIGVTAARTNGWRNITVFVCGGGVNPCGRAMLQFDGASYPLNPTVPPAVPTDELGTVLLTDKSPVHPIAKPLPET